MLFPLVAFNIPEFSVFLSSFGFTLRNDLVGFSRHFVPLFHVMSKGQTTGTRLLPSDQTLAEVSKSRIPQVLASFLIEIAVTIIRDEV